MWGGKIRFTSPMLYSIGFVSLFVSGGLSGIFLGQPTVDLYFHDTYFVVAHFHLIMGVAAIFGMFAGLTFWFPKMFGRIMDERLSKFHFWLTFTGVYAIFGPMHYLGMLPHPRRYAEITGVDYLTATSGAADLHVFITAAAILTMLVQFVFLYNFVYSLFKGKTCTRGEPVGGDHARMGDSDAAAARQLRRQGPPRLPRTLRLQPVGCEAGLRHAMQQRQGGLTARGRRTGTRAMAATLAPEAPVRTESGGGRFVTIPPESRGDWGGSRGNARVVQRYKLAVWIGMGAVVMFFAALTSAMIVRQGLSGGLDAVHTASILYASTAVLLASSFTVERARRACGTERRRSSPLVNVSALLGLAFVACQLLGWQALAARGNLPCVEPGELVLLRAHGRARIAPGRRHCRARLHLGAGEARAARGRRGKRPWRRPRFIGTSWMSCGYTSWDCCCSGGKRMSEGHAATMAEPTWQGGGSPFAVGHKKLGMWLFIVSTR